jgi:hypothetical protein
MGWDIGYGTGGTGNQTWLASSDFNLPSSAGIGLIANNISYRVNGGAPQIIGNLTMSGLYMGRNVTGITAPNLIPGSNITVVMSSNPAHGLMAWLDMGAYLDKLQYNWNTAGGGLTASGIYVVGMLGNTTGTGIPSGWTNPLTGTMELGGVFPNFDVSGNPTGTPVTTYAEVNVSGNYLGAGANGSALQLSLPMAGSTRVRDLNFGGRDMGPIAMDGLVFYRLLLTFRNIGASGY